MGEEVKEYITNHHLKILPEYFAEIYFNKKTFEVRNNDRHFEVDDLITLEEWTKENGYTGRYIAKKISYILDDQKYLREGYVILAIK